MGNCISQDQLATLMSVRQGYVHTLFANLCLFLLIEMILSFLLTLNIQCLCAKTSQRYFLWKIKRDLKELELFQNKVLQAYMPFKQSCVN